MEEEKENRPMSDVLSIKTDSGRPVRNTKRLNYQLVHSGKITETKRKTAKAPVSGNSSKVPNSSNKNSKQVSDTAYKRDLQFTTMDQNSNNSAPIGEVGSEQSRKSDDKETAKISVTIQEPKDEVDLYVGNKEVSLEGEGNVKTEDEGNVNAENVRKDSIGENANYENEGSIKTEIETKNKTEKERNASTNDKGNATLNPEKSNGMEPKLFQRQISKEESIVEIDHIREESVLKRPVRNSKRPNYSLLHKGTNLNLNRHERDIKVKPTQIDVEDDVTFLTEKDPINTNSNQINLEENEPSPNQNCSNKNDSTLTQEDSSSPKKKMKYPKVSSKYAKKSQDGLIKKEDFEIDESEEESEQERSNQKDLIVTLRNFFDANHLNLEPRSPTKADGNCFFRSIVDQLELHQIPHQATTHKKLRLEISNFLHHLPDSVKQTTVDVVFKGKKSGLKNLAYRQKKPGQFVDNNGIMVMATGLFLNRRIHVHSKTPDDCHAVTKIEGGEGSENLDPLTIFYFQDHQHYQSICKTV